MWHDQCNIGMCRFGGFVGTARPISCRLLCPRRFTGCSAKCIMDDQASPNGAREMTMQTNTKSYQEQVIQVVKYAAKMGWALDSPKVHKYAIAMSVNVDDLESEADRIQVKDTDAGIKKYAERMGLPINAQQVRKYATAGADDNVQAIDIEGSADVGFKEAVLHYAKKMDLELASQQVQKYAKGLLKPSGDFSEDNKPVETPESAERRVNEAIQRYAEMVRLPIDSEQVTKYGNGLKKTLAPAPAAKEPTIRRAQSRHANH